MRKLGRLGLVVTLVLLAGAGCAHRSEGKRFTIGLMPKIKSIAYFNACNKGAQEAAKELDVDVVYEGPAKDDVDEQIRILEQWITQKYDCIAVAPNDPDAIAPVLQRARDRGITVLTFDADARGGRQYFVNQASYEDIARTLLDTMAEEIGGKGKVGILTSTLQAPNQREWADRLIKYRAERYPDIKLLDEVESQESSTLGLERARTMIEGNPDLKGIIGLTSIAFPAAAEAVEQEGKKGQVHVVGLSLPSQMRKYVHNGTVRTVILWKPVDLGYLTVYVADLVRKGKMRDKGKIPAGRLKEVEVRAGGEVILGPPMKFTARDIDEYDF
jgi:rhamnose transport system substrate-binding protein